MVFPNGYKSGRVQHILKEFQRTVLGANQSEVRSNLVGNVLHAASVNHDRMLQSRVCVWDTLRLLARLADEAAYGHQSAEVDVPSRTTEVLWRGRRRLAKCDSGCTLAKPTRFYPPDGEQTPAAGVEVAEIIYKKRVISAVAVEQVILAIDAVENIAAGASYRFTDNVDFNLAYVYLVNNSVSGPLPAPFPLGSSATHHLNAHSAVAGISVKY